MKHHLRKLRDITFLVLTIMTAAVWPLLAQTNPPAQTLPFSFTSLTGETLPAGMAVHKFGTIQSNRTLAPAAADIDRGTAINQGGWRDEADNGISLIASNAQQAGVVLVAINTSGKTDIQVAWKAQTIYDQGNTNNLALQYRVGTSGNFTDLGDDNQIYTSGPTGFVQSFNVTLPAVLENLSEPVQLRWIYWQTATGSRDRIALDDIEISSGVSGPDVTGPVVSAFTPLDNASNVPLTSNLVLTFNENVVKGNGNIVITNASASTSQTISVTSTDVSVTSNIVTISNVVLNNGISYYVTVDAGTFADNAANIFAGISSATTWNFTTVAAPGVPVKISAIQGSGTTAAITGIQTIEGIVTRMFSGATGLNGFFVQEEDADSDGDATTSEGIFVYNLSTDVAGLVTPSEGDKVNLTGTVQDFVSTTSGVTTSSTQIRSLTNFTNLGLSTLPAVTTIKFPVANVTDLERYEGMLVDISATSGNLVVTEYFQLGRYGQVVLSATGASNQPGTDARLDQFTQFNMPSTTGYAAYLAEIAKRKIILDDGSTRQNTDPIIFGRNGNPLSATNTLRGGDEVTNIVGILDERLEGYRIQRATGVNFIPVNERPTTPPSLAAATLKVASANVLNYFTTLDAGSGDFRGANNAQEFTRQKAKIIKALIGTDADVIGLMEIQNNGTTPTTALQDLINGLNADPASSGTYAFVNTDPSVTGFTLSTDAITVGIIYKTDKVSLVGNAASLTTSAAFDAVGRRPLAQTFSQNSNGELFTVVVNHFKSKGSSSGGAGDADAVDGQSASNGTRSRQATDLAAWLATRPTGTTDLDYLILGDLNAYAMEDPLRILATSGYTNQLPATSYSYVFDGQTGSLDHALASSTLATQITGTAKWHINADEPGVLDYNTEFKTTGQVTSLYAPDQFRAADHDPVLVGLDLTNPLPVSLVSFTGKTIYGTESSPKILLSWTTASEVNNEKFEIEKSYNGKNFEKIGTVSGKITTAVRSDYSFEDTDAKSGQLYYYQLKQVDLDGTFERSRIIAVRTDSFEGNVHIYPNPSAGSFSISGADLRTTSFSLFDAMGRKIQVTAQPTSQNGIYEINPAQSLTSGMYHLVLGNADGVSKTLNIVVQ
ncbi:ExeM/NucH family extracellular endonuclease [Dyadobacter sp. CY345]|uniref:ExeM/NucH family extracellular endonuclease n=1 Tax=Dyadobacter sp. CY345 TaxID=2909335 RepID=UPI001F3F1BD2|nr:ExeM/NucH family extracellular endonuclease [Dyadobacter sp. CY345]MCF2447034.1 ExeM/NucH family extracellular endonuclease [Dyadobacter sp. CY345]